jgi:hypothetical protein
MAKKFQIHPLAGIFPLVPALVDEIAAELRKTRIPPTIMLHEGKVLDGRHRYLACVKAGIEPKTVDYKGKDARAFVIRNNITRRHLTTEERANLAARLATGARGGDRRSAPIKGSNDPLIQDRPLTNQQAAKLMRVSESSVKRAKDKQAGKPQPPKHLAKGKPGIMSKPLPSPPLAAYQAKVRDAVMAHIRELPVEFTDELGKLDPQLKQLVADWDAKATANVQANGADGHEPAYGDGGAYR